ncbi:MAG: carbohydrate kinase family protein [Candidatus Saccharimonadales bacterium]
MATKRLIVCGSIAIDRIMNFTGNYYNLIDATKLDVLSLSVLVDSLKVSEGGISANIAYYLAELGDNPVLLGSVGDDGLDYVKRLGEKGIDVSGVHRSSLPTASFNVLTDTSGNQVGGFYPGAMSDSESLRFSPWINTDFEILACISAHDPKGMKAQTEECIEKNIPYVYDPGQQVSTAPEEDLRLGVSKATLLIVNEYELTMLLKRTGMDLLDLEKTVPILVCTKGDKGSEIAGSSLSESLQVGIASPSEVVDPTGAGDAFRAGFLYGFLRQWDLGKCGRLGAVVASFALENHGPQTHLNRQDVVSRYTTTFNEGIEL